MSTGFIPAIQPRFFLDRMSIHKYFFSWGGCRSIMPAIAACAISKSQAVTIHELTDGPSPWIIYYLRHSPFKGGAVRIESVDDMPRQTADFRVLGKD